MQRLKLFVLFYMQIPGIFIIVKDNYSEGIHRARYELQYVFIPRLVEGVNEGYLPSTALHIVKGWDFWNYYELEDGFYIDRLEIGKTHTVVFYNFPEPQEIPEAFYDAVLIDNTTGKAVYYTLEYGFMDSWVLGRKTVHRHYNFGCLDSRERSDFFKWVTDRIKNPK